MRKQILKCCCMALAASIFLLAGCQTGERDMPTLNETQPPLATSGEREGEETMAKTVKPPQALRPIQLRLYGRNPGWWDGFRNGDTYYLVAENPQNLRGQLTQRGLNPEKLELSHFDDAFFEDFVLAVIPRTSSSGSVRFQHRIAVRQDRVVITVDAQVPEIGTCDMADWLVMVPVSRQQLRSGMTISVDPKGSPQSGSQGQGGLATR